VREVEIITNDLYEGEMVKYSQLPGILGDAKLMVPVGTDIVVLTGKSPAWVFLAVFSAIRDKTKKVVYKAIGETEGLTIYESS